MLIIAALCAVGFCIIGFLIKSWLFALIGLGMGLILAGSGFGMNYIFKKEDGAILVMKYLKPVLFVLLGLQALMAIAKLSS
jgi:hypothetical protein